MLMIAAVISAAACMQAAGGLMIIGEAGRTFITEESVTRYFVKPLVTYLFTFVVWNRS